MCGYTHAEWTYAAYQDWSEEECLTTEAEAILWDLRGKRMRDRMPLNGCRPILPVSLTLPRVNVETLTVRNIKILTIRIIKIIMIRLINQL